MNTIYRLISTIIDLTSLDRYGKQSSSTYGKIDDLTCSYDGNHLTAISDNAPIPTISGSFDFKDEASTTAEYLYDENGLRPDVTKGNNNRVVVAENDSIVQINHYYPYGGVIGDISTNENVQKYKLFHYIPREQARSEGKELDRTFGLDNYNIHARQYFAMAPTWDRINPLAENNSQFSPYSYCMGDPVNLGDYNGKDTINISYTDGKWHCSDPIMAKGDDVFIINYDGRILKHVFSAGEYGERVCILYLDRDYNPDGEGCITLSAYHVSGAEKGCTGFMASPAGETSLESGSNKSMPEGDYALKFFSGKKWKQPGIDWGGSNLQGDDRFIRFHPGKNASWTQGCYVFLDRNAQWNPGESETASIFFRSKIGC